MKPHRGPVILAFGILGLVVCQLLGIAAWMMADRDLEEMDRGYMDPSGRDLTRTGRILGMVSTGILVMSLILVLFFVMIPILAR
ncbi:MAG TPA: hypothetical protein VE969_08890 [Pyrinomonadaceae bacterium]|nr:hypothetical protein [Pyrinomonadaceae bacterium]